MSHSTQDIKFKFGRNKFGKMSVYNTQTRISFQRKLGDQINKTLDQL